MIGTVTVVKCESLAVDRLWEMSRQGRQAKVSRSQFETYYANQESGVGLWVGAAILFPTPIARGPTSSELGATLATPTADSTIER